VVNLLPSGENITTRGTKISTELGMTSYLSYIRVHLKLEGSQEIVQLTPQWV